MVRRPYNFNAGPAILPESVLKKAQQGVLNFNNLGLSMMEISHRSPQFKQILNEAQDRLKEILNIPTNYQVLCLGMPARAHFALIAMNFLKEKASYLISGHWSSMAFLEASKFGNVQVVANGRPYDYLALPPLSPIDKNSDYFYFTPNETLTGFTAQNGKVYLKRQGISKELSLKPYEAIEAYLPKRLEIEQELPFQGGVMGYLGYDLFRYYEDVPQKLVSLTNLPQMIINFYDFALIIDHQKKQTIFFVRAETNARVALANRVKNAWLSKAQVVLTPFRLESDFMPLMNKPAYQKAFKQIQHHLEKGNCYQVNYAHWFKAAFTGESFSAYKQLRNGSLSAFSAYLKLPQGEILSLSPERLITIEQRKIEARPIKGTMPRSDDKTLDKIYLEILQNSSKNHLENTMIVDLLRNDLSRICKPYSLKVEKLCALLTLPSVFHLESVITADLQESARLPSILKACFPGGSITGAPKLAAIKIIDEIEPHSRDIYCGSIGYISACGKLDLNIAIRSLVTRNQQIYGASGGGIILDSEVDEEFNETLAKISKINRILSNHRKP